MISINVTYLLYFYLASLSGSVLFMVFTVGKVIGTYADLVVAIACSAVPLINTLCAMFFVIDLFGSLEEKFNEKLGKPVFWKKK